jgi:endonuclease YncB( thermonuclease family)
MKKLLLLVAFFANTAIAQSFLAKVVGVTDGDTLTVYDGVRPQIKIRLSAIDAPESGQAFGDQSKNVLSSLCFGKQATIIPKVTDRYGRTVADVSCSGQDVGAYMVHSGMAWVYDKYAKGYGSLYPLQNEAKQAKRGLWADSNPTPPSEWRHGGKTAANAASEGECPCGGIAICTGKRGGTYCLTNGKKKYL